ncbi:glycosyltransferase family 2 protein [Rufibacter soli]
MEPEILVSVSIITYNQEKFIRQAIEGVVNQKVDFNYELVIGDDCSTDGTKGIILEYCNKYPNIIKPIFHPERNKGIPGKLNFLSTLAAAKGKYVALLDGDDYWIDPFKLKKQVEFLENNTDYVMCFHNTLVQYDDLRESHNLHPADMKKDFNIEDIIGGYFLGPLSVVYKNNLIKNMPEWYFKLEYGDAPLFSMIAAHGKIKYFDDVMGVYRVHPGGVMQTLKDDKFKLAAIDYYKNINKHFFGKYKRILYPMISDLYYFLSESSALKGERKMSKNGIVNSILFRLLSFQFPQKRQLYVLMKLIANN